MGMSARSVVFFGTWVDRGSEAYDRLDDLIDTYGGTPAPTGIDGIVLYELGSMPLGETQIAICAAATVLWYDPRAETPAPRPLTDQSRWTSAIVECLRDRGVTDAAEIELWFMAVVS